MSIRELLLRHPHMAQSIERDHAEALAMERQMKLAPAGTTMQHLADLNRFYDTCEDDRPYDVPVERMSDLARLGLVDKGEKKNWFWTNEPGGKIRLAWFTEEAACASA